MSRRGRDPDYLTNSTEAWHWASSAASGAGPTRHATSLLAPASDESTEDDNGTAALANLKLSYGPTPGVSAVALAATVADPSALDVTLADASI